MDWGRFEIDDNMDDDPDYTPDQEDLNEEELTIRMEADVNPVLENKYLVAHSCLVQLFTQCREPQCQYSTDPILRTRETLVTVTTECTDGHLYSWSSQPSDETLPWGNLSVAAAVLYSGSSYKKMATFFSHMKVPFISSSTFYKIQRSYLTPVVIEYWRGWQDVYLEMLEGKEVSVAGDGRCDSPGHCKILFIFNNGRRKQQSLGYTNCTGTKILFITFSFSACEIYYVLILLIKYIKCIIISVADGI